MGDFPEMAPCVSTSRSFEADDRNNNSPKKRKIEYLSSVDKVSRKKQLMSPFVFSLLMKKWNGPHDFYQCNECSDTFIKYDAGYAHIAQNHVDAYNREVTKYNSSTDN